MKRRDFSRGIPLALLGITVRPGYCLDTSAGDYTDFAGPLPAERILGNAEPIPEEEVEGDRIVNNANCQAGLLGVAEYFEQIAAVNKDGEHYNAAWAHRWNPVIIQFYRSTRLDKEYVLMRGDSIAWCAAFLNWCLACVGRATTNCASSSCFRAYGTETQNPKPGDIVVFRDANPIQADRGFGHVGLFVSFDGAKIRVLGGNQKAGKHYSSVCRSSFALSDNNLVFHSFRTVSS
jgi:uncharacterized protein (TIGR02594 family)